MSENRIEVPKIATPDQVKSFVKNGFLTVEGLVTPAELEELKKDTVTIARGKYETPSLKPLPAEMSYDEILKNILCIHQPHYVSPVMEKYAAPSEDLRHPEPDHRRAPALVGRQREVHAVHAVRQAAGVPGPGMAPGRNLHPHARPLALRRLDRAWTTPRSRTAACGSFPGSHRTGYLYPQRTHDNPDEFDFAPESHGFDELRRKSRSR